MLHLAQKIAGTTVNGTDGEIGTLEDFYFEEAGWNVRYLLVDTGSWFNGKRVLLSPSAVQGDWGRTGVRVNLSRDDVRNSPALDDAMPDVGDGRLDSVKTTSGYHIQARNGEIGHVDDFLVDPAWKVAYLVVDTSNWVGGKSVLISPTAIVNVDVEKQEIRVRLTRKEIEKSPSIDTADIELIETLPQVLIM